MAEDSIESQMLTDRQKEVKERQEREAALFPEIRSSPRDAPVAAEYRLPTLALNPTKAPNKLHVDETTSPSFPPDVMMNDFLGSSPTPSSSRKRSEEPYSDDGPPSSPPMISSHLQVKRTVLSPQHGHEARRDEEPLEDEHNPDEPMEVALPMLPPLKVATNQLWIAPDDSIDECSTTRARPSDIDSNLFSDMDVYVDAPTEPSRELSSEPCEDVDAVKEQLQSQECSRAAAENDQVTAQIMGEIAKASSQRPSPQPVDMREANEASKKRKVGLADGPRKRRRGLSLEVDEASRPSSGELVADCVLIDTHLSTRNLDRIDLERSEEQLASPHPRVSVTKILDNTPGSGATTKSPARGPQENDLVVETPTLLSRRVRVRAEPGPSRRSGRITRTSSRLSDVATSSPNRSEASLASHEQADSDPLPWVHGPRGSRWAYVPATAPNDAETPVPQPLEISTNDHREASTSQPEEVGRTVSPKSHTPQKIVAGIENLTAGGILLELRKMMESIKKVTLKPEEERRMVSLLFESVHQVHEAGRRHTTT